MSGFEIIAALAGSVAGLLSGLVTAWLRSRSLHRKYELDERRIYVEQYSQLVADMRTRISELEARVRELEAEVLRLREENEFLHKLSQRNRKNG